METIVCWYVQGNRIIPGFLGWCEINFATIHSIFATEYLSAGASMGHSEDQLRRTGFFDGSPERDSPSGGEIPPVGWFGFSPLKATFPNF